MRLAEIKDVMTQLNTKLRYCLDGQVRWAGDRCSVCDSDIDFEFDQLVSCDICGITVHQSCYGVSELPGEDDLWLCRACELKVTIPERPGRNCLSGLKTLLESALAPLWY